MTAQQAPQQAPNFTLDHITGNYSVSLSDFRGRMIVLLVAGRYSGDQAEQIATTLGQRYSPDRLPVISVLDMKGTPKLVQGLAKRDIDKVYQQAVQAASRGIQAQGQTPPADMSRVIIMLPDWQGQVATAYGLSGVDRQAVAILIDGDGLIRGYGAGAQGGAQLLSLFGQG
jgi:hypothetical protein